MKKWGLLMRRNEEAEQTLRWLRINKDEESPAECGYDRENAILGFDF